MVQKNVAEVKRVMEVLTRLRADVMHNKARVVKTIAEEAKRLETILDEEETLYVAENCPGADVVAVYDTKLNALSEAIGFLEERMLFPKEIVKHLDSAVMKLSACITD